MTTTENAPTASALVVKRRTLLKGSAAAAAGLALGGPFQALAARAAAADTDGDDKGKGKRRGDAGYGPLAPVKDQTTGLELLLLPKGFEYLSMGWTGELMSDGRPTPAAHDGMAAFRFPGKTVHLVRNHELNDDEGAFTTPAYDPAATGGTTTVVFDINAGEYVRTFPSLGGTIRNCAGGPTPWGTWLSCEETLNEPTSRG